MWIDLSVDLRPDFTWMTKQLFLYVTVDFETPENRVNQMVMWSHIITSKASADRQFWLLMLCFVVTSYLKHG